jgi:hypothetical protein
MSHGVGSSTRGKVIPHHLAVLHHESTSLQLADVGYWISGNGNEIGELFGLNSAHVVLPAKQFRGVGRDRPNDIEQRYAGGMQGGKHRCRAWPRIFPG